MATAEKSWSKFDGVKALIDSGVTELPCFYVKPEEQRVNLHRQELHQVEDEIPVIDLADLLAGSSESKSSIVAELVRASEKWGFFQVINHGVDHELMQQMLDVSHQFFQMPLDDKMVYYSGDFNAPVRYGSSFNPLKETALDWQDNLLHRFMPDHQGPHPWPVKPPSYRRIAEEYFDQCRCLAKRILRGLSEGIGLEEEHLEQAFGKQQAAMRLNYYPPCPAPELVMGLSSHSDIGGLTILQQDQVAGLQVKVGEEWRVVKPVPGAFVVNVGDQLQIFSNGRMKSVEHRAFANSTQARVSVAVFFDPSSDVEVAPISELLDSEQPALYVPCVFGDYVKKLFSSPLMGKRLIELLRTNA